MIGIWNCGFRRDVLYRQMGDGAGAARDGIATMEKTTTTHRRGIRRNIVVNIVVVLLLLGGALLGVTQMFILLAVYALVIAPA